MTLALQLDMPPTINTYWRQWKGRMLLSVKGRIYREHVIDAITSSAWFYSHKTMQSRVRIDITLHAPERAGWRNRWDIDNRIKPVLDALQHAGIYKDDQQVDELHVRRGEHEGDGLCVVLVTEI